jgi:glucokinase
MKLAIGIDLGGTLIKYSVVNEKGTLLFFNTHSTEANTSRERVIKNLEICVNDALKIAKLSSGEILGIGVGIPGVVDDGVVHGGAENLPDWENLHFEDLFSRKVGLPVWIENDANLMGLAEVKYGSCMGIKDAVFLTIGTGVGGALILNGKLYSGYRNRGSELGHIIVEMNGEKCSCGSNGCLQAHASTFALIRDYKNLLRQKKIKLPLKINGESIIEQYHLNDQVALLAMNRHFDYLAAGLASLINIFSPQKVVIGGGISESGDFYIENIRNRVFKIAMKETSVFTKIERAGLGNKAGILGAAALVFEHYGDLNC